jgi:hypothetical protein
MSPERLQYEAGQLYSFISGQPNLLKPPAAVIAAKTVCGES